MHNDGVALKKRKITKKISLRGFTKYFFVLLCKKEKMFSGYTLIAA